MRERVRHSLIGVVAFLAAGCFTGAASDSLNPFGVSASAQSTFTYTTWMPAISQAGVQHCRMFPEWRHIQPAAGTWDWSSVDSLLNAASAQGLTVSGLFMYSATWVNTNTHTLPMNNLTAWSTYVSNLVGHAQGRVRHWEVWNEPQGFAVNGTPTNYAQVVINAYDAAKSADPDAQIGLSVAANDVNYLERTIKAGAAGHFDFVAVHPYDTTAALEAGWEPVFMAITRSVRRMLAANDPARANVPIWFTELGRWSSGTTADDRRQATDLFKAYTMAIAQGVERINWYEVKDGQGGFGLLRSDGTPRPAYPALSNLTTHLGPVPFYEGFVQPITNRSYGFVFQGPATVVMAIWAAAGTNGPVSFNQPVRVLDPLTSLITPVPAASPVQLSNAPVLILDVPSNLLMEARTNKDLPFPWGGDFSGAPSVHAILGSSNTDVGLHQLRPDNSSTPVLAYGTWARDASQGTAQDFTVDPNFLTYTPAAIEISVVTRRKEGNDPAGFNLKYESTSGWKNFGVWYTVPGNDAWYTNTWTITDPQFVNIWGINFRLDSDSTAHSRYYLERVWVTKVVQPPAAPTGLTGVAASSSQIDLSWTDNAVSETGFRIERKTGHYGTYETIVTTGENTVTYSDTGLSASSPYYYRVWAYNAGGQSAPAVSGAITPSPATRSSLVLPRWQESTGFTFLLQGEPQTIYSVQWSADWVNWSNLTNLIATHPTTPIQDPGALSNRLRFYRAISP